MAAMQVHAAASRVTQKLKKGQKPAPRKPKPQSGTQRIGGGTQRIGTQAKKVGPNASHPQRHALLLGNNA